jgi:hypothetical protein
MYTLQVLNAKYKDRILDSERRVPFQKVHAEHLRMVNLNGRAEGKPITKP